MPNRAGVRNDFVELSGLILTAAGVFICGLYLSTESLWVAGFGSVFIVLGVLLALNYKINSMATKLLKRFKKVSLDC